MKSLHLVIASSLLALSAAAAAAPGRGMATHQPVTATPGTHPTTTTASTVRGPARTGQPMASCGSATAPNTPGNAASAPGSAFNEDGVAGSKYAGTQPQNSRNTASVSQYDAACLHQNH
jgi:hypothetical protein